MSRYRIHKTKVKKAQEGFDFSGATVSPENISPQNPYFMSSPESFEGGFDSLGAMEDAITSQKGGTASLVASTISSIAPMFGKQEKPGDAPKYTPGEAVGSFAGGFATGMQVGGPWAGLAIGLGMVGKDLFMQKKEMNQWNKAQLKNQEAVATAANVEASKKRSADRAQKYASVLTTAFGGKDNPYVSLAVTGNELIVNQGDSLDAAIEKNDAGAIRNIIKGGYKTEGEFSHNTNEQYVYQDGSVVDDKGKMYDYRINKGANIYNPKQINKIQAAWGSDEKLIEALKSAHREQIKHGNRETIT